MGSVECEKAEKEEETNVSPKNEGICEEVAGPSNRNSPKPNVELVEVKPELKDEVATPADEDSNQEDDHKYDEEDSDYDVKDEMESEASDSDESIKSEKKVIKQEAGNSDSEDDNVPLAGRADYHKVFVQNFTSSRLEEDPITNFKHLYKKSRLEFEKEKFYQQIFEQIMEQSNKISLKELQAQYLTQLRQVSQIDILSCTLCNYQTISKTSLKCHLLLMHNAKVENEVYKCNKCDYDSNFQSYMIRHLETHMEKKKKEKYKKKAKKEKFPCTECSYKGRSPEGLNRHMQMHKDNTKCDLCSFQSKDKNALKEHKNTHRQGEKFLCYVCDYTHKIKLTLARHLLDVHQIANEASKRSKICEICSHSFSNIHQLRRHYITHKELSDMTEGEIFKCNICNHQTKYKANFKLHMLVHKAPDLVCEICGFATRRQRNYDYHLITHKKLDEIEWFRCQLCPYQARNKKLLGRHMKRGDHSGKRLVHVRNRDRLREAEERGEDINALIKKYRIKKINGVEIKRERLRKPRDPNKKRVRKSRKKPRPEIPPPEQENEHTVRLSDILPPILPIF